MKKTTLLLISATMILFSSCGISNRAKMKDLSNDSRIAIERAESNKKATQRQAQRDIDRSNDLIDRYESQIKDLKRSQSSVQNNIVKPKKEELKLREEQLKKAEKQAKSKSSYAAPTKAEIKAMKSEIKNVKDEIKRGEKEVKNYDKRIKEIKKDIKTVKKNIKDSEKEIKDAKKEYKQTREDIILNDQIQRVK